jgi:hypothetical protein
LEGNKGFWTILALLRRYQVSRKGEIL